MAPRMSDADWAESKQLALELRLSGCSYPQILRAIANSRPDFHPRYASTSNLTANMLT